MAATISVRTSTEVSELLGSDRELTASCVFLEASLQPSLPWYTPLQGRIAQLDQAIRIGPRPPTHSPGSRS